MATLLLPVRPAARCPADHAGRIYCGPKPDATTKAILANLAGESSSDVTPIHRHLLAHQHHAGKVIAAAAFASFLPVPPPPWIRNLIQSRLKCPPSGRDAAGITRKI